MKPQSEFKLPPRRRLMSEINVVPYIDVMLVLLVVFMITAPMMTQGIKVDLPDAAAPPINLKQDEPLVVSVKRDGRYHLNAGGLDAGGKKGQSIALEDILARVAAVRRQKPDTLVLVEGDEAVAYGKVVRLMAALQQAGVRDVGLVTELAPAPPPGKP